MKKAVGYCRYSSSNQREESIEAQIRAIEQYCKTKGIELIRFYKDEAISGTSIKDRESFLEMISDSKTGEFELVIVHKYDRFARNRYDHAIFERKLNGNNVLLISVLEELNDSPESIILKSVLTGMNEYYSLNLSREVKKGKKENALKGVHNGGLPPLGYDLDENKKYIVNQEEAKIVRLIFSLAYQGLTYADIANTLNEQGYKNKSGSNFKKTSIRDTLLNMKYIGTYFLGLKNRKGTYLKDPLIIENSHEAIVDKSVFYKVQERFKISKNKPRKRKENYYLLTSHCTCGLCGAAYVGGYRTKNRYGTVYYGYQCRTRKNNTKSCKNRYIRKEKLEKAIVYAIKTEILNDKNIKIISKDLFNILRKEFDKSKEIERCKKEIEKLNNKSLKLLEKNLEGVILEEIFYKKNQEINQELNLLKSKLYSLQESNGKSFTKEGIEFYLHNLKNRFNEKIDRSIIELFVKDIKIFPDNVIVTLRKLPNLHKSGDPDGVPEGVLEKYYLDGNLMIKDVFGSEGIIQEEIYYKNGNLMGFSDAEGVKMYYDDGQLLMSTTYSTGETILYHENGNPMMEVLNDDIAIYNEDNERLFKAESGAMVDLGLTMKKLEDGSFEVLKGDKLVSTIDANGEITNYLYSSGEKMLTLSDVDALTEFFLKDGTTLMKQYADGNILINYKSGKPLYEVEENNWYIYDEDGNKITSENETVTDIKKIN